MAFTTVCPETLTVELATGEVVQGLSHFGSDRTIAESAWVSSDRASGRTDEDVARLVRYLVRHNHWTPLAHASCRLRLYVPIFTARQIMRSNVGIVWNEESRRYVDSVPTCWGKSRSPVWRGRGENIKQGSAGALDRVASKAADNEYMDACNRALTSYRRLLELGVCPEQARAVLPVSTMTNLVGSFTLPALARVCALRTGGHAQREIQELAAAIDMVVGMMKWCPEAWRALRCGPGEKRVPKCTECDRYPADHKGVCEGCLAYREHQA
jgi:thymidylate synthase (FAD)